jgi:periplasmic protein TonB
MSAEGATVASRRAESPALTVEDPQLELHFHGDGPGEARADTGEVKVVGGAAAAALPEAAPAFGAFLAHAQLVRRTARARRWTLATSLLAHAALIAAGIVITRRPAQPATPPKLPITLLRTPRAPGHPPPAAETPPRPAAARPRRPPPVQPPQVIPPPPRELPPPEPAAADEAESALAEDADADAAPTGGVAGGTPGAGTLANAVLNAAPPPPRPPALSAAQRKALLDRYLAEMFRTRVQSRFRLPPEAEQLGIEGTVLVRVWLDRQGRLLKMALVGGCAHELLCDHAQRTLREAAPFPPPPAELGPSIDVEVPLNYRLQ